MSMGPAHSDETLHRRKMLSRTWAVLVVAWSLMRALIVWAALGDYGINPWVYLGIDLFSAGIDAFTTPRMVLAFIDERYSIAAKWLSVSAVAFVIPDVYIFIGTRELPKRVIAVVGTIIVVTFTVATIGIVRKVHKGRLDRQLALQDVLVGL